MQPSDKNPASAAYPTQVLRGGDTGSGIPPSEGIEGARPLTKEKNAGNDRRKRGDHRERLPSHMRQFQWEGVLNLPSAVTRLLLLAGLLVASVLGLVMVTQIAALVVNIEAMTPPWNWVLGTFGSVCASVLVWIVYKLIAALLSLHRSPGVNLANMEAIRERREWQQLAKKQVNDAEQKLRTYLDNFKLDTDSEAALLASGLSQDEIDTLDRAKKWLLDSDRALPSHDWLKEFVGRFQSVLDHAGERCAKNYGKCVGLGTALSPVSWIDQTVLFYLSIRLIRNLVVLYNVRPAFGQTTTLFARTIIQTYLGGEIEEITEMGTQSVMAELFGASDENYTARILSAVGLTSSATAKTVEGAMNGMLVWRLGIRAQSFLQPVKPSK